MKRLLFILLLCTVLLLTGCADQSPPAAANPDRYIQSAQLTPQEELIRLLSSQGRTASLYDFQLGSCDPSLTVNVYMLEDNQWVLYTGGSSFHLPAQNGSGRFALNYGPLTEGIVTTMVDERGGVMSLRQAPAEILCDVSGLTVSTTALSGLAEVQPDEEIPLLMQLITSQLLEDTPETAFSLQPDEMAALGHEYVFLVTASFSLQPLE